MRKMYLQLCFFCLLSLFVCEIDAETLVITGTQLNVRSGPGRTHDVVEVVKQDEKFEILQEQDGWYQISVEGAMGWVSAKAVEIFHDTSLQELLQQAERYFHQKQFTTPPDANAYDLYRRVLQQDPDNAQAQRRIEEMARAYKSWAERADMQGNRDHADAYYRRYLFLKPDDDEVRRKLQNLDAPGLGATSELRILRLRDEPMTLSSSALVDMVQRSGFHHPADWSSSGLTPGITGNIRHDYQPARSQQVELIRDHATGLMWQQVGPTATLTWTAAFEYISGLNRENYAGFRDWRLPTVEELASLIEAEKGANNLYLHPFFGSTPLWCWSSDRADAADAAWYVSFSAGGVQRVRNDNALFVLAVRTQD